jgi:outer membrane protein assembly factor BamB
MFARIDTATLADDRRANQVAITITSGVCLVAAVVALGFWLSVDVTSSMALSLPGEDGMPPGGGAKKSIADMMGVFTPFGGEPADLPGSWTQFRGPDSDNIVKDSTPLAASWPENGPEILWELDVGEGYAAPVVLNGAVYLMDYDQEKRADALRCLSLADGSEIWRRSYEIMVKRNHGMSRTIPVINEKYIVTMGPKCHVVCLDTATGDYRWGISLLDDYGTEVPLWYTGQCPIIENGHVIVAPGGTDVLMMAIDCETGEIAWQVPNPHAWQMSHSSIIPMTLLGKRMYVYCALGGLVGVSAEGDDVGQQLWEHYWTAKTVAPSPVPIGDDQILMVSGYGKGNLMLKLAADGAGYAVEVVYERGPKEGVTCEQQTPIVHDGLVYSIMPKDAGAMKGQFVCYQPDGTMVWSSGNDNRFGLGPFLLADEKFYILNDHGGLTMLDATASEYKQLGHAQVLHGHDAWGPLALAGSRMLLRDMNKMVCIELGDSAA